MVSYKQASDFSLIILYNIYVKRNIKSPYFITHFSRSHPSCFYIFKISGLVSSIDYCLLTAKRTSFGVDHSFCQTALLDAVVYLKQNTDTHLPLSHTLCMPWADIVYSLSLKSPWLASPLLCLVLSDTGHILNGNLVWTDAGFPSLLAERLHFQKTPSPHWDVSGTNSWGFWRLCRPQLRSIRIKEMCSLGMW